MSDNVRTGKLILYTFLEVVAVFILTAMAGLYDWVNWKFSLDRIKENQYWIDTAVKTTMYSMALLIGIFAVLEWNELHSKAYFGAFGVYVEKLHAIKDKGFVAWIHDEYNAAIKKEALHKKYNIKLHFLDAITRDKIKIEYKLKVKDPNYNFKYKASARYEKRFNALNYLNSNEYIDENYDLMHVRYKRVNPYAFTEHLDIHVTDTSKYKVENHTGRESVFQVFKKVIVAFGLAAITALFMIDPSREQLLEQANGWIAIVFKYAIRVLMIAFNIIMGCFTGKKLFNNNFLLPIVNRTRILEEYNVYKLDHPTTTKTAEIEAAIRKEYESKLENKVAEIKQEAANIIESMAGK